MGLLQNVIILQQTLHINPTNDKCANCKSTVCKSVDDIGCILKLFETFEGFVLQPHQGHEFGDVSMLLKYQGRNMTFQGIAKSVPSGTPLSTALI